MVALCRMAAREWAGAILLGGVTLKLVWEQSGFGAVSADLIGGNIVVDPHLYGAVSGRLVGLLIWLSGSCRVERRSWQ